VPQLLLGVDAALFAVGVMSLGWMALIAAFIAGEKPLPRPAVARWIVALLLLALGLGVAFVPGDRAGIRHFGRRDAPRRQPPRRRHADDALSLPSAEPAPAPAPLRKRARPQPTGSLLLRTSRRRLPSSRPAPAFLR
jgi:hypothetical protein